MKIKIFTCQMIIISIAVLITVLSKNFLISFFTGYIAGNIFSILEYERRKLT